LDRVRELVDRLVGEPSTSTATFTLPAEVAIDEPEVRRRLYWGAFRWAVDRAVRADGTGERDVRTATRRLRAAEGPMRFELADRSARTWERDTVARARMHEIVATEGWLVPKLEDEIVAYRARIEALRDAIEERRR
jgi:hypothetical protein